MSLKSLVKENFVLVMGITLPLLLIVLFFVASVLPKSMSTPPQYEMLFTTTKYESQSQEYLYDIVIRNAQVMVKVRKNKDQHSGYQSTRLMAFDGRTQTVREIPVELVNLAELADGEPVPLPSVQGWKIDTASVSPDGYILDAPHYSGGNLLGGIFGLGYRDNEYRLKKEGVGYRIPASQSGYYYYGQLAFVGWVLSK